MRGPREPLSEAPAGTQQEIFQAYGNAIFFNPEVQIWTQLKGKLLVSKARPSELQILAYPVAHILWRIS